MNKQELIKELLRLARSSDDAARANEAGAASHRNDFETYFDTPNDQKTQEMHDRAMEIYEYNVEWIRNAKQLRKEAETFRQAAKMLEDDQ